MKIALITGSAGLIGSGACKFFHAHYNIGLSKMIEVAQNKKH